MSKAVEFEDVSKYFGDHQVLKSVSLSVSEGEVLVIIGPSGSGKSTLIRCANGLEAFRDGRIWVNGNLLSPGATDTLGGGGRTLTGIRKHVGMVFQQFNLFPHKTALENVALAPMRVLGKSADDARKRAAYLLGRVGLEAHVSKYPGQLSGGQQQRVAIARALAMDPRIMLFDEPTSALDPEMIGEVLDVMRELAADRMTMMIVTHEMGFAREVAHRVMYMEDGRIIETAPPDQLFNTPGHERTRTFLSRVLRH